MSSRPLLSRLYSVLFLLSISFGLISVKVYAQGISSITFEPAQLRAAQKQQAGSPENSFDRLGLKSRQSTNNTDPYSGIIADEQPFEATEITEASPKPLVIKSNGNEYLWQTEDEDTLYLLELETPVCRNQLSDKNARCIPDERVELNIGADEALFSALPFAFAPLMDARTLEFNFR